MDILKSQDSAGRKGCAATITIAMVRRRRRCGLWTCEGWNKQ